MANAITNLSRLVQQRDTKENCNTFLGTLEEGAISFATDTGEFGLLTNGAFVWFHLAQKSKLDATAAPAVTDDSGDGYAVGSVWVNVTTDKAYICVDATAGAAVWLEMGGGGAALNVQEVDGTPSVDNVTTIKVTNGTLTDNTGGVVTLDFGSAATDGAAIHDNVDGEINAITEKTTLVDDDLFLIEDSAASYAKKKVKKSNLGGGGYTQGARAYHSSNQTIGNNAATTIALNSERYDTDTIHDNTTNNSRLTCKTAGTYLITGQVEFAANGTGHREIYIYLNGATYIAIDTRPTFTGIALRLSIATIYVLAVNDYVELRVRQSSGGDLALNSTANFSPEFSMQRIG